MSTVETTRVLIDSSASRYAFRVGQALERLLIERALDEACRATDLVVTIDQVRSCLDASMIERVREQVDADAY